MKPLFRKIYFAGNGLLLATLASVQVGYLLFAQNSSIILYLEKHFAPDGNIACLSCVIKDVQSNLILVLALWFVVGLALIYVNHTEDFAKYAINNLRNLGFYQILSLMLVIFLTLIAFIPLNYSLFREDGVVEQITAFLFLASSSILATKFFSPEKHNRWILLLLAIFALFSGMEELSWGQRVFQWDTPNLFNKINHQNETNIHNVVIPPGNFEIVYCIFTLIMGYALLFRRKAMSFLSQFSWFQPFSHFYPKDEISLFGYLFLLYSIRVHFHLGDELVELAFSVFWFTYTLGLFNKKITSER